MQPNLSHHIRALKFLLSTLLLVSLNANADSHDVFSTFFTEDNGSKIHISDCGDGTIYDPGKDKTDASRIKKLDNGKLEVKGCISFLCVTQIWTEEKKIVRRFT
jgi:hypothetical protein